MSPYAFFQDSARLIFHLNFKIQCWSHTSHSGYRLLLRASLSHDLIADFSGASGYQVVRAAPVVPSTNKFVPGFILEAQQQALFARFIAAISYLNSEPSPLKSIMLNYQKTLNRRFGLLPNVYKLMSPVRVKQSKTHYKISAKP